MRALNTKIAITFPTILLERVRLKASAQYGFDVPEMMRKLAADYIDDPRDDIWEITPEQEAQYMKDILETKKFLAKGQILADSSVKEMRKHIADENKK